ncbi:MAG: penicillin-binding protein [Deltaproteobacteria bacterium]|nr:MAG: penicillin-binding protein [Deltaproteobacteria bacterium]
MPPREEKNPTPARLVVANPRPQRPLWQRLSLWVITCLVTWGVLGFSLVWVLYLAVREDLPELPALEQYNPPGTTRLFSLSGILTAEFAIERRDVVPASRIPRHLVEAFIASEDDNFFSHGGIDPLGILRAAIKNIKAGHIVQGGSTITQQVAKSFIGRQKTFTRKFKEAVLALRLERKFSKEDILYLYLNQIYLGHGSYGVQAAARNYFHRNVWRLTLPQMATLAGLPQAPSDYDPVERPQEALRRRRYVLGRMREEGYIDQARLEQAAGSALAAHPISDYFRRRAPYFTEEVRRQLQERYGTEGVYEAGLRVETTVDLDWQHSAQLAVNRGLRVLDHRQGYRGPLLNLKDAEKRADFLKKTQQWLERRGLAELPSGTAYPAVVEEVHENWARVAVGLSHGLLPVFGMRWARKPDPTVHYQSSRARVTDVRKVLRVGDLVLVRRAQLKKLLVGEAPAARKLLPLPKQGPPPPLFSLEQIPGVQGALVSAEPRLGYVRALIGGYNFADSEFNRVLQACRQPGSAFKPIHYSLAIEEHGFNPATIIIDSAIVYDDPENQNRWKPENYERQYKGKVTVYEALVHSMNVPSIKVMDKVGVKEAIAWAHKLGITTGLREELGLALGSSCVKPWDLLNVYSVFNMGGKKPTLTMIGKVTDRFGRVLLNRKSYKDPYQSWDEKFDRAYDRVSNPMPRLISPEANYILVHLLEGVATRGTGARARQLGKPAAGKTGTTNDSADAWFMGFTHDVVTGVWVGHDEPKDPLGRGENGSRAALPIWLDYMKRVLERRPQAEFDVPAGITLARIDPATGLLARPDTPGSVVEAFRRGEEPKEFVQAKDVVRPGQFFKVDGLY